MILGDNIFHGHGLKKRLVAAATEDRGSYGIRILCG